MDSRAITVVLDACLEEAHHREKSGPEVKAGMVVLYAQGMQVFRPRRTRVTTMMMKSYLDDGKSRPGADPEKSRRIGSGRLHNVESRAEEREKFGS